MTLIMGAYRDSEAPVSLTLSANVTKAVEQTFSRSYGVLAVAANRILNVIAAVPTEDERDTKTGPREALFER